MVKKGIMSVSQAMECGPLARPQAGARGALRSAALRRVRIWLETSRQRRALARLDAARLEDIGLDPEAAAAEAARPFWDPPAGWR